MLPWPHRLYFWGVHGIFAEILFTGSWEFVVSRNWRLMGVSSIWAFFIYGLGTFFGGETLYNSLRLYKVHLLARCLVYVVAIYVWEFSSGVVLDKFDARPWDYSAFDYNIKGYITFEYFPVWYFAGLYFEWVMSVMKTLETKPTWLKYD